MISGFVTLLISLCHLHLNSARDIQDEIDYILGHEVYSRLFQLGQISEESSPILSRPAFTNSQIEAIELIAQWMQDAQFDSIFFDISGNLIARNEPTYFSSSLFPLHTFSDKHINVCENPWYYQNKTQNTLTLGSHYDTVNNGGMFDGAYGVLASIAVVKVLNKLTTLYPALFNIPFAIEVVAFENEENNNPFGFGFTGSRFYSHGTVVFQHEKNATIEEKRNELLEMFLHSFDRDTQSKTLSNTMIEHLGNVYQYFTNKKSSQLPFILTFDAAAIMLHVHARDQQMEYFLKQYSVSNMKRNDLIGFIEIHIEQGPTLLNKNTSVGVVTAINGQSRLYVTIIGEAGHGGTVPMYLRKNALNAAAKIILFVEQLAINAYDIYLDSINTKQQVNTNKDYKCECVGTVGQLDVFPGSANVIPNKVSFSIDFRCPNNQVRLFLVDNNLYNYFEYIENQDNVKIIIDQRTDEDGIDLTNSKMIQHIEKGVESTLQMSLNAKYVDAFDNETKVHNYGMNDNTNVVFLPSGALHDAQILAEITDSGMIFIRCKDGISHNPKEFITLKDSFLGASSLFHTVVSLAYDHNIN